MTTNELIILAVEIILFIYVVVSLLYIGKQKQKIEFLTALSDSLRDDRNAWKRSFESQRNSVIVAHSGQKADLLQHMIDKLPMADDTENAMKDAVKVLREIGKW